MDSSEKLPHLQAGKLEQHQCFTNVSIRKLCRNFKNIY